MQRFFSTVARLLVGNSLMASSAEMSNDQIRVQDDQEGKAMRKSFEHLLKEQECPFSA